VNRFRGRRVGGRRVGSLGFARAEQLFAGFLDECEQTHLNLLSCEISRPA